MSSLDLSQVPGLTPPPGVTPNFVDPPSTAPVARIITAVSMSLMYCFLALRVYTRIWVTCSFGVDDFLCLAAAATVTAYCVLVFLLLRSSMGPHQWDVPLSKLDIHVVLADNLVSICLYAAAAILLKSALIALYLRIFRPAKGAKILIWASLIVIVLFYLISLIVDTIICGPYIKDARMPTTSESFNPDENCSTPQRPLWITMGIFGIVSDFYLLAIPVGLTLNVQLAPKRKIGVCCIFLTGLLACAFSVLSTVYRFQLVDSLDLTWLATLTYAYTAAELNVGIACSCMPVISVVFHSLTKTLSWSSLIRLITTHRRHTHNDFPPYPSDPSTHIPEERLPQSPQGTRIALRSFVRRVQRSQPGRVGDILTYSELISIDEDYHSYLKKQSNSARNPRLVQPGAFQDSEGSER
ncbi:hypothetical protein F4677DRAFT_195075 [Hypoxylon crocopeplum]|nr:hypothetical protein F4677DRAFT_195075 [Hypoxylon crocopeplum]